MAGHTAIPLAIITSFGLVNITLDPIISDHVTLPWAFSRDHYWENGIPNFLRNYGYIIP